MRSLLRTIFINQVCKRNEFFSNSFNFSIDNTQIKYKNFTLTELLVVISIMVILSAIGVKGYKRLAGEASLHVAAAQVKQLVLATAREARSNGVPMQITINYPNDKDTESARIVSGQGSLISYFGFDHASGGNVGINGQYFNSSVLGEGFVGQGYSFSGTGISYDPNGSHFYSEMTSVYFEAMFKLDQKNTSSRQCIIAIRYGTTNYLQAYCEYTSGEYYLSGAFAVANPIVPNYFPEDSNIIPKIPRDGAWHKVGVLARRANGVTLATLYFDSQQVGEPTSMGGTINDFNILYLGSANGTNPFNGYIDEVKVYNLSSGASFRNEPKNVYVLDSGSASGNYRLTIGPDGKPIGGGNQITIVSQLVGGDKTSAAVWSAGNAVSVSGSSVSNMPENGYVVTVSDNSVIRYRDFNGSTMNITDVNVGNSGNASGNNPSGAEFYLAIPILVNANGTIK